MLDGKEMNKMCSEYNPSAPNCTDWNTRRA